ncbi:hypothetical protein DL96DRAFT_1600074 [Flagelloscypha sp. PMI_526]|nr:hypothetical protein DL96DRAFT_1600074 [Flagelloscypha sp. PMI_526]
MPLHVYALHPFEPQNDDELSFRAGEMIEVVEKDDQFGDGWWLGKNTKTGAVGLFPQSYTAEGPSGNPEAPFSIPSSASTGSSSSKSSMEQQRKEEDGSLTPLQEDAEPSVSPPATAKPRLPSESNGHDRDRTPSVSSSLANAPTATMTDVQRAIESLGKRPGGANSFISHTNEDDYSFRSRTNSILSLGVDEDEGAEWHKEARTRLAEKARRAVEEAERLEEMYNTGPEVQSTIAPPIHVEMSDNESDSEPSDIEDETDDLSGRRRYVDPHYPSSDEEEEDYTHHSQLRPARDKYVSVIPEEEEEPETEKGLEVSKDETNRASTSAVGGSKEPTQQVEEKQPSLRTPTPPPVVVEPVPAPIPEPIPVPAPIVEMPMPVPASPIPPTPSTAVETPLTAVSPAPKSPFSATPTSSPSSWTLADVLTWVRQKNFGEDVVDKFIEQDITGDVLLDLDAKTLKEEIGIMAFGKRVRIANAITELKAAEEEKARKAKEKEEQAKFTEPLTPATSQFTGSARSLTPNGSGVHGRSMSVGSFDAILKDDDKRDSGAKESVRRRLFGRSHDSKGEEKIDEKRGSRGSGHKEGISPTTPAHLMQDDNGQPIVLQGPPSLASPGHKKKGSVDSGGRGESESGKKGKTTGAGLRTASSSSTTSTQNRSSLFGSFGASKAKRKAVPRSSDGTLSDSDASPAPSGGFNLGMLYTGRGASSGRPSTPSGQRKETPSQDSGKEVANGTDGEKPNMLRKRTASGPSPTSPKPQPIPTPATAGSKKALDQIGEADFKGWMRKKAEKYGGWKLRYFVLKGRGLYVLRSEHETKVKVYIDIVGYRVTADENLNPGKYGFRIEHDTQKTHYFSSDDKAIVRGWMKAIMKATIDRDYTRPVISSVNIPTIPLIVAQAMNPAPRPPSPGEREKAQRTWRRENPNQLSSRDARVLMGLSGSENNANGSGSGMATPTLKQTHDQSTPTIPPPRPARRGSVRSMMSTATTTAVDSELLDWANARLPSSLQVTLPSTGSTDIPITGLHLLRLAETIKGRPASPPVPDSAFPVSTTDDKLDGLFRLFDFMLDNDVKVGNLSINDVRIGRRDKIVQLLLALKEWEKRRRNVAESMGASTGSGAVGGFVGLG